MCMDLHDCTCTQEVPPACAANPTWLWRAACVPPMPCLPCAATQTRSCCARTGEQTPFATSFPALHALQVAFTTTSINGVGMEVLASSTAALPDGEARLEMRSGCIYEGEVQGGKLHGHGTLTFPDGMVYTGDFHMNDITGHGVRARV